MRPRNAVYDSKGHLVRRYRTLRAARAWAFWGAIRGENRFVLRDGSLRTCFVHRTDGGLEIITTSEQA